MHHLRKLLPVVALIFVIAVVSGSMVYAGEPNQTTCPVMGGSINESVYTDYQGKRVYFCCPACIPQFKKNPDKYIKQLEEEGVVLESAPPEKKK